MARAQITRDTYGEAAARYIKRNDGRVYYIAQRPARRWKRDEVAPEQFHAWLAYFSRLGLPCHGYRARGYLSAPAPWPHHFDKSLALDKAS